MDLPEVCEKDALYELRATPARCLIKEIDCGNHGYLKKSANGCLSAPGSLVVAHQFDIRLTAQIAALRRA
jgi:hypothetical protein